MSAKQLRRLIIGGSIFIVLLIAFSIYGSTGIYFLKTVDQNKNQIGVRFSYGRIDSVQGIVGPGVYSNLAPFSALQQVDIGGKPFVAVDEEVITLDRQRIGVRVTGTVHRPGLEKADFLLENWSAYRVFYTNDEALLGKWDPKDSNKLLTRGLMQDLGQQAMKVCVGDRTFDKSVIGSARDDLRDCICTQLDELGKAYGLDINNVMVPNVTISAEVQKKLDEITEARLATDLAHQNELKAVAEASQKLAVQQGDIRVEQGKVQERAKQDAITAALEKTAIDAKKQVIESQKANDLLSAEKELKIQQARRVAMQEQAKAELSKDITMAELYQANPGFVGWMKAQALASAYKQTDKVIIPAGTDPIMILGGEGVSPIINVPSVVAK